MINTGDITSCSCIFDLLNSNGWILSKLELLFYYFLVDWITRFYVSRLPSDDIWFMNITVQPFWLSLQVTPINSSKLNLRIRIDKDEISYLSISRKVKLVREILLEWSPNLFISLHTSTNIQLKAKAATSDIYLKTSYAYIFLSCPSSFHFGHQNKTGIRIRFKHFDSRSSLAKGEGYSKSISSCILSLLFYSLWALSAQ